MAFVTLREGEGGEQLLKRFQSSMQRSGVLRELRNRRFFSLAELNQAIRALLKDLNGRVTRHLGASRRTLFEELERPALRPGARQTP